MSEKKLSNEKADIQKNTQRVKKLKEDKDTQVYEIYCRNFYLQFIR